MKEKKADYSANLNRKDIIDNERVWKKVNYYSWTKSNQLKFNKIKFRLVENYVKITLVESGAVTMSDVKIAELINILFSSAVSNHKIPQYRSANILAGKIPLLTLKVTLSKTTPV